MEANLEFILEDNEDLQKQLTEKVKEIELLMEKAGVQSNITKTNIIKNRDGIVLQDLNNNKNISINK